MTPTFTNALLDRGKLPPRESSRVGTFRDGGQNDTRTPHLHVEGHSDPLQAQLTPWGQSLAFPRDLFV